MLVGGCAGPPLALANSAAASAGAARIWFYRDYAPSVSRNLANVALNGAAAGSIQPGGSALHRDVAPGHSHIIVESAGTDATSPRTSTSRPVGRPSARSWHRAAENQAASRPPISATRSTCR